MAEDIENDDQWLYGENADLEPEVPQPDQEQDQDGAQFPEEDHANESEMPETNYEPLEASNTNAPPADDPTAMEPDEHTDTAANENVDDETNQNGEAEGSDKDFDEDSDDDVNVVIGDFVTTPAYSSLNIKRGALLTSTAKDKTQMQSGKFTVDEFEQAGMINGISVTDFNLDSLEDKPWRKPGADITDYFNYGFNEDTWRAYCERQKRMRVNESGTGLLPLNPIGMPRPTLSIMNDNSKYTANYLGLRKAGPPPARRMTGAIDVIGIGCSVTTPPGVTLIKTVPAQPKENVIQVMTADRREYSRKPPAFPDMSVPPPSYEEFIPEINFNPEPEPFYGGYEPTQDVQWGTEPNPAWQPQEIKTLTSASPEPAIIPPIVMPPGPIAPSVVPPIMSPVIERSSPPPPRRSRSRERESSRREIERPRDRERSHRRDHSRSRSRRHKSRSRSASRSHRSHSHRKKKSRRHSHDTSD